MQRFLLALACAGLPLACASRLKHDLTDHAPGGQLEQALDLGLVRFQDFDGGSTISVSDYMKASGHDFLLLVFGSQRCTACNHKAEYLENEVIGKHPLYLTDTGRRFEIIGVNTDDEPRAKLNAYLTTYPFVRWSDPAGVMMLRHFMPVGQKFSVPLTVMLTKDGIAWRVLPKDPLPPAAMIAKVQATLGLAASKDEGGAKLDGGADTGGSGGASDAGSDQGTTDGDGRDGNGSGGGDGEHSDGGAATPLAEVAPARLNAVTVTKCDLSSAPLGDFIGDKDLRFVAATRGACADDCRSVLAALQALTTACAPDGALAGRSCGTALLTGDAPDAVVCASGMGVRGGAEFFETFSTHFNWSYLPQEGPAPGYKLSLPAVAGPLVLGFDRGGQLVYSHEGRLEAKDLVQAVAAPGFGAIARGPDFPLYRQDGAFAFADWRRAAKYTVVSAFGVYPVPCGSCMDELQQWSKAGALLDFCQARPSDCQIAALETHLPDDAASLPAFYQGILQGDGAGFDGFAALGIRVPLLLDPMPLSGPQGDEYLHRMFDGYMLALRPDWGSEYRTFVYDREGKVVAAFRSETPNGEEPVLKTLRSLLHQ